VKRPYREGDWFAVPLGDGRFAAGIVTRGTRKAIYGSFFGPARDRPAHVDELVNSSPDAAIWSGRFSDRAIVEQRWPVLGSQPRFARGDWQSATAGPAVEPGLVERRLACLADAKSFQVERMAIRDLRSPIDLRHFSDLPGRVQLQWRESLQPSELAAIDEFTATNPQTSLRLRAKSVRQVNVLSSWRISHLDLDVECLPDGLASFPNVIDLTLDGVPRNLAAFLDAFPGLQALHVRGRGGLASAAALAKAPQLRSLELRNVALTGSASLASSTSLRRLDLAVSTTDDADSLLRLPLQSLRLCEVAAINQLEGLRGHSTLLALSLVGLIEIDDLRPIATIEQLASLELRGLWQFDVEDVGFVECMPSLLRLRLDIGGRRKNSEIYKRRSLALPQ
jgi:Immunity protein 26